MCTDLLSLLWRKSDGVSAWQEIDYALSCGLGCGGLSRFGHLAGSRLGPCGCDERADGDP